MLTGCVIKQMGKATVCTWADDSPSPKIFDHLWASKTKAVGTVMLNRKEMPKLVFSVKLKKGEKISCQRDHFWPSSGRTPVN
jgi:hypothetical protein